MRFHRRHVLASAAAAAFAAAPLGSALAQAPYPSKPITIVVAYPAGGDTDSLARTLGEKLGARLGQTVVVDNRPGAAGTIGTTHVARSPADGYTLLLAPNTVAITPHVTQGVQYDVEKDLTPIALLATQSLFVVANTNVGATNLKELVAATKAGKISTYASPGNGSPMHILGELFNKSAGIKLTQVPYRGSAPAVADLVGGHVPIFYTTLGPVQQYITAGKLVNLGVADPQRSPFQPAAPTLAEAGFKNSDVGAWQALLGPKGMPADLVKLLNQHVNEILKMPDVVAKMQGMAMVVVGGEPAALGKLVSYDYERYGKVVKEFGIRAD